VSACLASRLPAVASLGRVATVVTNPLKVFAVNAYALARPSTARPIEGELFRRDPAEPPRVSRTKAIKEDLTCK
jgi:hypothetical protein